MDVRLCATPCLLAAQAIRMKPGDAEDTGAQIR